MIDDTIYINKLYDCYSALLTDVQREYFEDYYFQNLTCQEIGDNKGISRNAVNKQIKDVVSKLVSYEEKLNILKKSEKLDTLSDSITDKKIKEEIKRIIWE